MSDIIKPEHCHNCGSVKLRWHCSPKNLGGVQDGRICMREVGVIFFLGCEYCSETIRTVSGDQISSLLSEMQESIQTP